DYLGNVVAENIIGKQINAKLAVADELWVARYQTGEAGEVEAAPDSNKIRLSSTEGFRFENPDGEPIVVFPTQAYDDDGNVISAIFRGRVISDDITVLQGITMQGKASDGYVSRVALGAKMQLESAVADPDNSPEVSFGPAAQNWPAVSGEEIGWGTHIGFVVQGRVQQNPNNGGVRLDARFIDPA